jgi:hypothetical protein
MASDTYDAAEAIAAHGQALAQAAAANMPAPGAPPSSTQRSTREAVSPQLTIPKIELTGSAPNYLSKQARGKLFGWSTFIAVLCVVAAFVTFAVWHNNANAGTVSSLFLGVAAVALVVAYLAVGGFGSVQLTTSASAPPSSPPSSP